VPTAGSEPAPVLAGAHARLGPPVRHGGTECSAISARKSRSTEGQSAVREAHPARADPLAEYTSMTVFLWMIVRIVIEAKFLRGNEITIGEIAFFAQTLEPFAH
jgi:hypothetical protein